MERKGGGIGMLRPRTHLPMGGRRLLIFVLAWAAWMGMFPNALAWGEDRGIKILTREEALKIALEKNKDILKAREYKNSVEGRYVEERSAVLPQLTLNAGYNRDRDDSLKSLLSGLFPPEKEIYAGEVVLSQALYTFGRVRAAIRAAKMNLPKSQLD
jgi:outer membrane protein TolC